jgi:hypothetical protein
MLESAIAAAEELKRALETEVERSRIEREALRTLDSDRIFAGAAARASFNAQVGRLEQNLAGALQREAGALGLAEVTLAALRARAPKDAGRLARALQDVRASAAALAELDRLTLALAGRALACVQGYLTALDPAPAAYDRRGLRTGSGSAAGLSTKA